MRKEPVCFASLGGWKWEHMVALAPGSAYVRGADLSPSSRRQHARTKLQRRTDDVAPGSWLTFANLCFFSRGPGDADGVS